MAAPETEARQAIIELLQTEFADEEFPVWDDKLHESVGHEGTRIAVYPERTLSSTTNRYVNEMELYVQFFGKYDLEIDPLQKVSPARIEGFADRFRRALFNFNPDPDTGRVWYFVLENIEYSDDPTGNRTRFVARLRARGNNTALVETSG